MKFRMDDPHQEGWDTDIPILTVAKVLKGQSLDFHLTLFQETRAAFGREPLGDTWPNEDAVLFSIRRKPTDPKHQKIFDFSGGCKLDDRTLRTLAEEIDVAAGVLPFWDSDSSGFVVGIKRFIFNALLYMGSFPEEYEPEKVLRSFLEKKGRWKPAIKAARFLGQEAYRPAQRPSGKEQEPMGRKLAGHWRCGHWVRQPYGPKSLLRKLIWSNPTRRWVRRKPIIIKTPDPSRKAVAEIKDHLPIILDHRLSSMMAPASRRISVDGQEVAKGRIERTVPIRFSEECFEVGEDTGTPVNLNYDVPFKFTGKIEKGDD